MKILYFEDSFVNVRVMQRLATHAGHELIIAANGAEGMTLLDSQHPDVILMDISLPDIDGLSLTKQIRQQAIAKPIIAVTAHAMVGDRERFLDAGCTDYISKPYEVDDMVKLLAQYDPELNQTGIVTERP